MSWRSFRISARRWAAVLSLGVLASLPTRAASAKTDWKEVEGLLQQTGEIERSQGSTSGNLFNFLNLLSFRLDDFIKHYPDDARRWNAELIRLQVAAQLNALNGAEVDWAAQEAGFAAVMAAPKAKGDVRVLAQANWFHARLMQIAPSDDAALAVLAKEVDAFYDRHQAEVAPARVAFDVARRIVATDPARAESLLKRISRAGDDELPSKAAALLRVVQLRGKPLDVSFTALSGEKVDLAALRGKVVLIDFWATWCPPCREETPEIVEAYRQLHDRGFEIIGISLDEERTKLSDYLKANGMTWAQHYDGGGWDNKFATRFDIHSIPAMWLVNKQGYLVDIEGRDQLAKKIERLLAE